MTPEHLKNRAERKQRTCKHFNGVQHGKCRAGICYDDVQPLPCLPHLLNGRTPALCAQFAVMTAAEAEAEAREWAESVERFSKGHAAAKDHAKAQGLGRGKGGRGELPCPVCATGTLYYSVAGVNGHMHGKCSTQGCVAWME